MATRDFGQRRSGRGFSLGWGLFGLVLVAAAVAALWWQRQSQGVADYRHWVVKGPPCAATSKAALDAAGVELRETNVIDQVRFDRAFGHVSCTDVHDKGGRGFGVVSVCQFSSPQALGVITPKGRFYYLLPAARPVVVSVERDVPVCAFGTTEWDRMGS